MAGDYLSKERAAVNKISISLLILGTFLLIIGIFMLSGGNEYGIYPLVMGAGVIVISAKNIHAWNRSPKVRNEYALSEKKLVEFLLPYHQITLMAIAEHFFPLGIKFAEYPNILHVLRAMSVVRVTLEKLILTERIRGSVQLLDGVWYYTDSPVPR